MNGTNPTITNKKDIPLMVRKFLQSEATGKTVEDYSAIDSDDNTFKIEYYFFYGTLMDPSILAKVPKHPSRIEPRPAKIIGYSTKFWGDYPALIDGPPGNPV
ncbi:hypothetical protein VTN96DRAFT_1066 [Rasamsonia emersonii]|uniref:Gamma-glutamylcyclotransferase AIG2-like domain-containing protein n=1 Tax=Rasamsonia emersonii (strain ATCC 16479 / CBS 393.64 / IMI 116815) TaxID=1408163 RepID=A0A0F4YHS7_RASE3|nr:Uncharacterized protein T310_8212 [Rasamsonia emersonii CBS 393.64]KKA17842.1 Uncharacterized protein T310_8212 [Rasamsonia emersonii CBS 393.64]